MYNNKVFLVLNSFSKKEMTRFFEFCHSPYHNKHKGVRALVKYLEKKYPDFSAKSCSKKKLLTRISGIKETDLPLIFTYTKRVLDAFLMIEEMDKDSSGKSIALLRQLREHKIYQSYEKEQRKTANAFFTPAWGSIDVLKDQYQLAYEADKYYQVISRRKDDSSLQKKQQFLDYFYIAEKLKDAVEMLLREQILQVQYSKRLLFSVVREVEENWDTYQHIPIIMVYFQVYQLVESKEDRYYFQLIESLEAQHKVLDRGELIYIYNILQNYCIQKINANHKVFLLELFKLYQSELEMDLLLEEGVLLEWHYKNIVTTALRLGELDWTANFIEEYKHQLNPDAYENAYRFNLAALSHARGDYGKVLELLVTLEYIDLRYNLGAKALLLRTYFEMGETDSLVSLSSAFKQFLKRNKLLSETRKKAYVKLFSFTEKLALLRDEIPYQERRLCLYKFEKIASAVDNSDNIFNKAWLEEKMAAVSSVLSTTN